MVRALVRDDHTASTVTPAPSRSLRSKDLITAHVPLSNVLDAFALVKAGEAIKVTVEP